jgi:hypothetical protein
MADMKTDPESGTTQGRFGDQRRRNNGIGSSVEDW